MSDSTTVQLSLVKGSSAEFRTGVETSTTSSSSIPATDRDGVVEQ